MNIVFRIHNFKIYAIRILRDAIPPINTYTTKAEALIALDKALSQKIKDLQEQIKETRQYHKTIKRRIKDNA